PILPLLGVSSFSTNVAKNSGDSSDGGGGAIYNDNGGKLSVFATQFSANVAGTVGLPGTQGYGGAIYAHLGSLVNDVFDSIITGNTATTQGSGLYLGDTANIVRDTISANGSLSGAAEAVLVNGSFGPSIATIANTSLNGNNTIGSGSTIEVQRGRLVL